MTTTSTADESMMAPPAPPSPARGSCHRACGSPSALRIAAIVIGFVIFWPLGLALLVWTVWGRQIRESAVSSKFAQWRVPNRASMRDFATRQPDNRALAAYLEQEQQRLKAEQTRLDELVTAFDAFKNAEQRSADQRDFDAFLRQRDSADQSGPEQSDKSPL